MGAALIPRPESREGASSLNLPHSIEAEIAVLGSIILDNATVDAVAGLIAAGDFYREAHQTIYQVCLKLAEADRPIDLLTLSDALSAAGALDAVGGAVFLASLVDAVPSAANAEAYARIVHERALLRRLLGAANQIATRAQGAAGSGEAPAVVEEAEQIIFQVAADRFQRGLRPAHDVVRESYDRLEQLFLRKESLTGIPTGFERLDDLTCGFQKSDLLVLAARPSMGKTALALNIAEHAALEAGKTVAVFSLEMSADQLIQRVLCSEARVDSNELRRGFVKPDEWGRITEAAGKIARASLYIDDTPAISALEMRSKARRLAAQGSLDLVIVDYLQLMRGRSESAAEGREREISDISRSLKALAKELNVPVLALSQLNRGVESRDDKRPRLADLRESGAIEQDADVIMFIYRDEVYDRDSKDKGVAEIILGKQRNGPIGLARVRFFSEFTRFENLAEGGRGDGAF